MASTKTKVGFQHQDRRFLAFELKITTDADIYMLIFERGHRRMHISYHADGRLHYKADRPNADSVLIETDFPSGEMEPLIYFKTPPLLVVEREEVGVTGWALIDADIEKADLNQFAPDAEDILINQPEALSLGFCVKYFRFQGRKQLHHGPDARKSLI
jgi:hypothetical protein